MRKKMENKTIKKKIVTHGDFFIVITPDSGIKLKAYWRSKGKKYGYITS